MKSSVRLLGEESALLAFKESIQENYMTNRTRETCKVLAPNSKIQVLGIVIGTAEERSLFFEERLNKLIQLRDQLADIEDAGIELILGRLCANISRVTHLFGAHGCHLCPLTPGKI